MLGFVLAVTSASTFCRGCFPSVQMKILDELLKETRRIYEQADAENLFPSELFRKISKSMLVRCVEKSILCFSSFLLAHKVWNNAATHFAKALTTRQRSFSNFLHFSMGFQYTSCGYRIVSRNSGLACMLVFFIDSLPEHNDSFQTTIELERRKGRDGSSALLNNGGTADTSVLLLMSIDPSFDPESVHGPSSQQFDRSSDPRRRQSASRHTAPSEPDSTMRDVPVGLGDSHHHGKYNSLIERQSKLTLLKTPI